MGGQAHHPRADLGLTTVTPAACHSGRSRVRSGIAAALAGLLSIACQSAPRNLDAISAYYRYDFHLAREGVRGDARLRDDGQTILNLHRLGAAALADGDLDEAETMLRRLFELLSTAGLNQDRTTAAVLVHEGVRIWKGEPFEQALAYYHVSLLYMLRGDWENARAAIANALFRLTDFGEYRTKETVARRAAGDDTFLDRGYTAVDTDFTLGFLLLGLAADIAGAAGAPEAFAAARSMDPGLTDLADTLEARTFDTLLVVEFGKGPTKIAYGPDDALSRFEPQDRGRGPLLVDIDDAGARTVPTVLDVNRMAADHRWNAFEDVRRAKSILGDLFMTGGLIVATADGRRAGERVLIGAGMVLAGLLTKSGARADTRYFEFAPQRVYLVPLRLGTPKDVLLRVQGGPASGYRLPDLQPGTFSRPRVIYARMHGHGSPQPPWLAARSLQHGNDHTGVRPGDGPWILGGSDLSTPSGETLSAYQRHGWLRGAALHDLESMYAAEEILIGAGAEHRPGVLRNPSFRHIVEGGTGLFTPHPDSMGYKRVMYTPHAAFRARSPLVRNAPRRDPPPPNEERLPESMHP